MVERLIVPGAPTPVGPFPHAVRHGGLLFVTGQMPTDPASGAVVGTDVATQTRQVLHNLRLVVEGAGGHLSDTVMARAYLTFFQRDFDAFNAVWVETFGAQDRPARTTVGVTALAVDALVEVDLIVALADEPLAPVPRGAQNML